jgi:streptogramin lyase
MSRFCVPFLVGTLIVFSHAATQAALLVSHSATGQVHRYNETTGAFEGIFASGIVFPGELTYGPDGHLYVSDIGADVVRRFDGTTGAALGIFATGGGLDAPGGSTFGPDGNFYVVSDLTHNVLRFNGTTGAFMDVFASGLLTRPADLAFGPDGNLYVTGNHSHNVVRFNGLTGALMGVVTSVAGPTELAFGPDGFLYVGSNGTQMVRRIDPNTGSGGPFATLNLNGEVGDLVFGPDGNLWVAADRGGALSDSILRYDGSTGAFLGNFANVGSGTNRNLGITFMPQAPIPEPASLFLWAASSLGFAGFYYRRQRARAYSTRARRTQAACHAALVGAAARLAAAGRPAGSSPWASCTPFASSRVNGG